ncbi:hypothetical protein J2Y57_003385 [Sphingomonas sp. BE137]|nr:hypothetical protein [Sphingomonas sp. BE137]
MNTRTFHRRVARYLVAEELQMEDTPAAPRAGCTLPLLAGFLSTIAIGLCVPGVAAIVMGAH